ncbi:TetR/AcrR family transcriptional regulator C-terminal domain-containing protein [Streptomyces laculatispora]|uniref:TetR/AcrR family transcriptional regulator C-terminal domain-containing protein n=1 Tax=Streptomyces laculatispora TaxID=887464 RepID=UPI001A941D9B|nr:TetR/AcrR family transcriptional regulator C-terminal domain-containing protein [Streptomyces laculatispora]MBO0915668.1 TetR/AcrR family transcriptional regulator C-terminal domain-containing protein [Streptomyces laculatispora]
MPTEPPYLRIAAELRRRIASSELAPGARVPSTRAVVREWGVAMATATKALAVLRAEGLVRAVPGVGTVVADRASPLAAAGDGPALNRARIVRTAVELADAEGLPSVSMRRVATILATSTMALYRHVPGKAELVRLMSEEALGERPLGPVPQHWRTGLELAARWLRAVYGRHPWMARAMASFTRPTASPHAMRYTEWVLRALKGTGLPPHAMLHTHLTLFAYVQGLAQAADLEAQARQDTGLSDEEWMARNEPQFEAVSAGGHFQVLHTLFEHDAFELDLDVLFEFGLGRTLDGIAVMIGETSA